MFDEELNFLKKLKIKELEFQLSTLLPVIKLDKAKYLIGTEVKMLEIQRSIVMVRIGGGYQPLLDYLKHAGKSQSLKLNILMEE
jgi:hypothetical protein